MSYDDVLDLPLKVFSLYNTNISRLRAEEDIQSLLVGMYASNASAAQEYLKKLEKQIGNPIVIEKSMDVDAMEKLRRLSGQG